MDGMFYSNEILWLTKEDVVNIIKEEWEEFKESCLDPDTASSKIIYGMEDWIKGNHSREQFVIRTILSEVEQTMYEPEHFQELKERSINKLRSLLN